MKNFKIILLSLICLNFLYATKILVLPWTTLGMELEPTKAKVTTKLFAGEIAKLGKFSVFEGEKSCENIECALEQGKEKGVDIVILGSLNRLEARKYFFEIKAIEVSTGNILYITQYPLETLENIDVAIKLLAKAYVEGKQAEEVALEEEGGWKRKAKVAPSIRFGYNYFVGENSYRREHIKDYQPDPLYGNFSEPQPQRAFNLDLALTYFMTNTITVDFIARFEFVNRGMQLLVPMSLYFAELFGDNISIFAQAGVLFGFGPPKEEKQTDYWMSERDGFGLIVGMGALFFRSYDFNLIFNPRYTIIFNKINDQGIGFTFGIMWSPKARY